MCPLWFWNGLPAEAREKAGILFARGGEQLGLTGATATPGRLFFAAAGQPPLVGQTELRPKDWHQVVLARAGRTVAVYLDSSTTPEILGEVGDAHGRELFFGGGAENTFGLEGKLDEVAVFDRALKAADAAQLHRAAGLSTHPAREVIR